MVEEVITNGDGVATAPVYEGFCVDNQEKADWVMGLMADVNDRKARIKVQYTKMLAQLDSEEKSLEARFKADLENFLRTTLEETRSKRKSLVCWHGTLALRSVGESLAVEDDSEVISIMQNLNVPVVTTETRLVLDKTKAKQYALDHLRGTGELLEGFQHTPAHDSFSIRFAKASDTGEE